jgi:hypothetical protein
MDGTEKALEKETRKWLERLEKKKIEPAEKTKDAAEQTENIRAYIQDSRHFLEKGDYIRAFEAVVYAWGIYETLERLGFFKDK